MTHKFRRGCGVREELCQIVKMWEVGRRRPVEAGDEQVLLLFRDSRFDEEVYGMDSAGAICALARMGG